MDRLILNRHGPKKLRPDLFIERLHVTSQSIKSTSVWQNTSKNATIRRRTTKLKLQTDCCNCYCVLLLCLGLYFHRYQERSKNRARFSDKILPISADCMCLYWVHISDHHYLLVVSSHHTRLRSVVDSHRRWTSAPLLYI